MIKVLTEKDINYALLIANHLACVDICQNYAPGIEVEPEMLIVPCYSEALNEFNTVQYSSKIEHFGDDIVINGTKSFIKGADRATHFMVFVGTMVKERDGKIYKRTSTVLVPADADGVTVNQDTDDFYNVEFEDVEIEPQWVVGRVGYGVEYLNHLKNCQKLSTSKIILTLMQDKYNRFKSIGGQMGERDATRETVAKCHLDLIALNSALEQVVSKKGFTFDGIQAELNCCHIMARRLTKFDQQFNQLRSEYNHETDNDENLISYLCQLNEADSVLLAQVGFIGFR